MERKEPPGPGAAATATASARRSGRRERKREATRAALVAAAMALVRERGLFGTRVEDITERCDVAKGAFYLHFESKDALLAELLARGVEALCQACLAEVDGQADHGARLRAVSRAHARFFATHPAYTVLLHQGRGLLQLTGGDGSPLRTIYRGYLHRLAALVVPARRGLTDARRLDLAALVAGAVAGHHSFRNAAGLEVETHVAGDLLAAALPDLAAARA